jgi:outer membrane receptor for ferrienterochelin and colicins
MRHLARLASAGFGLAPASRYAVSNTPDLAYVTPLPAQLDAPRPRIPPRFAKKRWGNDTNSPIQELMTATQASSFFHVSPRVRRIRTITLCAAAGFMLAPLVARSAETPALSAPAEELADLSLERLMEVRIEKVFGASKYEQKVTQAPAAVTIVTADEIANYGHRTLADVLRSVRGLYVSNDSNYSYLGSRGFLRPGDYNTRNLVLIDGHRMNDNVYDSVSYGRENMVDVADIDRVEVVRGPSSSIYGSSAFLGVINIVTRRGRQLDGWEAATEVGSFGTVGGGLSFGRLFKSELEVFFSASYYQSDGRDAIYYPEFDPRISDDPRAANDGVAKNRDAEDAFKLLTNVKFREFTFSGFFATRDKTVPTASFLSAFNQDLQETNDTRGYLDLRYEHEFSSEVRMLARASYDSYDYTGDYPIDYAAPGSPPEIVFNRDLSFGEWLSTEWQTTATLFGRHTLVAGAEFRKNLHQEQVNYDDFQPREYYLRYDASSDILGAYVQAEIALQSNLLVNVGVRYDHYYGTFGGTLNPRLGVIYNLAPRTTIKALYGQAFRAPNVYERFFYTYFADSTGIELTPEKIRTYEVVLEHYFAGDYRFGFSAYHYNVSDLVSQVALPDDVFGFANVDRYSAEGLEFEFEGRYAAGLNVRTSYAIQQARDEATDEKLTSSPGHLAKINVSFPLFKDRLTGGLELQYHSSVRTLAGKKADDFLLGNFTLTALRLPAGFEASASIYNLFNTRYGYPGAEDHAQDVLLQEGRSLRLKLSCRF